MVLMMRSLDWNKRLFFLEKFDITKHSRYKELSDYDQKNTFDIEDYVKLQAVFGMITINAFACADSIPMSVRAVETSAEGISIYQRDPKGRGIKVFFIPEEFLIFYY